MDSTDLYALGGDAMRAECVRQLTQAKSVRSDPAEQRAIAWAVHIIQSIRLPDPRVAIVRLGRAPPPDGAA
jgi:hypothetical protein